MKQFSRAHFVITSLLLAIVALRTPAAAQSGDRMVRCTGARFGMLIRSGLYSVPAGEWGDNKNYGEWIQLQAKIPGAEYEKLTTQFNPVKFDPKQWVRVA